MSAPRSSKFSRRNALKLVASTPLLSFGCASAADRSPPRGACVVTPSNPEGPYYRSGAEFSSDLAKGLPGQPLTIVGSVGSSSCRRLSGAVLDLWQCDHEGRYDHDIYGDRVVLPGDFRFRGRIRADGEGNYRFTTIVPAPYYSRPRHIHVKVTVEGHAPLTTQLYFRNDPMTREHDWVEPELLVDLKGDRQMQQGRFDIVLANQSGGV